MHGSAEQTLVSSTRAVYSPCCPLVEDVARRLDVPAYILAGGVGSRLGVITAGRPKPLVPFAGHHRVIDFTLSNCANSGITDAALLTQHMPEAIERYVGDGAAWGFTAPGARLRTLRRDAGSTYLGTADAVLQRLPDSIEEPPRAVLVLAADHVYRMDYAAMVQHHLDSGADLTIGVITVPLEDAHHFGVLACSDGGKVERFEEKPEHPASNLVSMGIYVFEPQRLRQLLAIDAAADSSHDFGHDVLPLALELGLRVQAYEFRGYWRDIGTAESYWAAHRDLLLGDTDPGIAATLQASCSRMRGARRLVFGDDAVARVSSIFGGCVVDGTVERSVLAPGVHIGRGAIVRDSILLAGVRVEDGAIVDHAVLDERSVVGRAASVGSARGGMTPRGEAGARAITVVAAGARVANASVVVRGTIVTVEESAPAVASVSPARLHKAPMAPERSHA